MYKTVFSVEGMHCGMCESFVNDVVRNCVSVKKVTSSARRGETVVITEEEPDCLKIKDCIEGKGYRVLNYDCQPFKKKGLFGR